MPKTQKQKKQNPNQKSSSLSQNKDLENDLQNTQNLAEQKNLAKQNLAEQEPTQKNQTSHAGNADFAITSPATMQAGFWNIIKEDFATPEQKDPALKNPIELFFNYPGVVALFHYRFAHFLYRICAISHKYRHSPRSAYR